MAQGVESWRTTFVGREDELAALHESLRIAAPSLYGLDVEPEPSVIVLRADSGFGKSRIVQEFYRRLAVTPEQAGLDPDDYWPDAFGEVRGTLRTEIVNPVFDEGLTAKKTPPFIWWGVKWSKPSSGRDGDRVELAANHSVACLDVHRSALKRRVEKSMKMAGKALKAAAGQVGLGWFDLGWAVDAGGVVSKSKQIKRSVRDAVKGVDVATSLLEQGTDRLEQLKQLLVNIMHPPGMGGIRDAGTPLIIWLDDAQWMTPEESELVRDVLRVARINKSELLVIATHWESDWLRHVREHADLLAADEEPITRFACLEQSIPDAMTVVDVRDTVDFSDVLRASLPGLTPQQHELVLDKTEGHPWLFKLVMSDLVADDRNFAGRDRAGPLSEDYEEDLESVPQEMAKEHFVQQKLEHLEDCMQEILKWSSLQGGRFLQQVNERIGDDEGFDKERLGKLLQHAIDPEAILQSVGTPGQNEFRQAIFQEVLRGKLRPSEKRKLPSLVCQAIHDLLRPELICELTGSEQEDLLTLARVHLLPRDEYHAGLECGDIDVEDEQHVAGINAMVQLMQRDLDGHENKRALELARELVRIDHELDEGLSIDVLDAGGMAMLLRILRSYGRWGEAGAFRDRLQERLDEWCCDAVDDMDKLSKLYLELAQSQSGLEQGEAQNRRAIELAQAAIDAGGDAEELIGRQAEAYRNLYNILDTFGQYEASRDCLEESKQACDRLADEFGETDAWLELHGKYLNNLAYVAVQQGRTDEAAVLQERALDMARKVLDRGATPERTRSLIIRITNITHDGPEGLDEAAAVVVDMRGRDGDTPVSLELSIHVSGARSSYEHERGRAVESRRHAAEAVRLARLWIELHGEGTRAMNALASQLGSLAFDHEIMYDFKQARQLYQESLEHRHVIAERSDETPDVLASLCVAYINLGDVDDKDGQPETALSHYEQALTHARKAVELSGRSIGSLRGLAAVLNNMATVFEDKSDFKQARRLYQDSLEHRLAIAKRSDETPGVLASLCVAYINLGNVDDKDGQPETALSHYEQALTHARKAVELSGRSIGSLGGLAAVLNSMAVVYENKSDFDKARQLYQESLEHRLAVSGQSDETPDVLDSLRIAYVNLGDVDDKDGQPEAALSRYEQALTHARKAVELSGRSIDSLRGLAAVLNNMAIVYENKSDFDQARRLYQDSLEHGLAIAERSDETPGFLDSLRLAYFNLGGVDDKDGQPEAALSRYEQALTHARKAVELSGRSIDSLGGLAAVLNSMAVVYENKSDFDQARRLYQDSLEHRLAIAERSEETPGVLDSLRLAYFNLGGVDDKDGQPEAALSRYEQALTHARKAVELSGRSIGSLRGLAAVLNNMAIVYENKSDFDQARRLYQDSLEHRLAIAERSEETPGVLDSLRLAYFNLGGVDDKDGQPEAALSRYEQALTHARKAVELSGQAFAFVDTLAIVHDRRAAVLDKLGRLVAAAAAKDDEIQLRREMLEMVDAELVPKANRNLAITLRERIELAKQTGEESIEADLLGEAVAIEAEYPDAEEDG